MILADSSAWIEYLRHTGSPIDDRLRESIATGETLATTEVVVMEVLAGARDDAHRDELRRMLYGLKLLPVGGLATYESAAEIYRLCRKSGETVRNATDCLIAAVAIREETEILHSDADFDKIAAYTSLKTRA